MAKEFIPMEPERLCSYCKPASVLSSNYYRASIYGKKKFKFLLALLDPKNQQKSIQYLQSGKKTLNYSSLDPPYFDQFENANFWGKNLVKLEIGPLEKILRGVEKEEVGRN